MPIDIVHYAVHLQMCGNAPSYIQQQISGIVSILESRGHANPTKDARGDTDPRLRRVLHGIKRKCTRTTKKRLPVTTTLLKRLVSAIDTVFAASSPHDRALLRSAMTLSVYGLLRIGEISTLLVGSFEAAKVLLGNNVRLVRNSAGRVDSMEITITAAKSDFLRQGATMTIHRTGGVDCPVAAMVAFLTLRGPRGATPLYTFGSGRYLTRPAFTTALRKVLSHLRCDVSKFSGHSMRAGGAISMACAGFDISTISICGRWKSLAVLRYLREMPPSRARTLQERMSRIQDGDVSPAHVRTHHQRFG